ncbi:Transposase DDE domain protein [Aquisphaera giovannonii]|uniref:Transposase DDE domain protein n=1 Tax=Aquisphaera giovannonii TaxID=406548 RepID=A0A5B9VT89_9BACT|nr:IS4 family transposase [Aquisphaera giovannonii]QEH31716.1 Transposase DDE domain protein [Aquisphaera giovannonii]
MAKRPAKPLKSRDIRGVKYVERLLPLLDALHEVGCGRDKAGNRCLFYDQYCMLVLLSMFNPVVRSLRAIQQVSGLRNVQRKLGCSRASLGSLSEAVEVFEPGRLLGIIDALAADAGPVRDVRQGHLAHALTAVDGSVVKTLKSITEAAFMGDKNGGSHSGWRLHTHFDIDRGVPVRIDVTRASNSGKDDEKNRLRDRLEPDHCYVMDRWYAQFTLFRDIVAAGSSYVCRVRDNTNLMDVVEERPVTEAAKAAGVIRDVVVNLGGDRKEGERPGHPVRIVMVRTTPHTKRGGRKGGTAGPSSDGILRIATSLLDVPAEIIANIYKHRWTIELFFRFFKHVLGCRRLLSTHEAGIEIQAYCAIIACLLISLWTERKPTLRTYEMICHYFTGLAGLDELVAHLEGLKRAEEAKRAAS